MRRFCYVELNKTTSAIAGHLLFLATTRACSRVERVMSCVMCAPNCVKNIPFLAFGFTSTGNDTHLFVSGELLCHMRRRRRASLELEIFGANSWVERQQEYNCHNVNCHNVIWSKCEKFLASSIRFQKNIYSSEIEHLISI